MAERIIYEKYGPGKFFDSVGEWLYEQSLDFTDEEAGDVSEIGIWYGLLLFDKPFELEKNGQVSKWFAAIISENDQGFVEYSAFTDRREAERKWENILEEIEELYSEIEDEDEDLEEEDDLEEDDTTTPNPYSERR